MVLKCRAQVANVFFSNQNNNEQYIDSVTSALICIFVVGIYVVLYRTLCAYSNIQLF